MAKTKRPLLGKARARRLSAMADVGLESVAKEPGFANGGRWIAGAIKHPGAFRAKAQAAGESTAQYASEHAHDKGTLGRQARLAQTLMAMHRK